MKDKKIYWKHWPNAVTDTGEKLFTYDSCDSVEECLKQFDIWENHYHYKIADAWIDTVTLSSNVKSTVHYKKQWVADGKVTLS